MKQYLITISIIIVVVVSITVGVTLYKRNKYKISEGELSGSSAINDIDIMGTWDSKSDEVIKKLHPKIRTRVESFVNDLSTQGIKYRLYSGYRDFNEQAALYGKGRTKEQLKSVGIDEKYASPTEKIVTNAKPGSSYHNYGLAFDGVEIKDGTALWKSHNESKIVATGTKYGFYWGGNFTTIKDTPHFEDKQFGSVSQLLALYNENKIDGSGYLIV